MNPRPVNIITMKRFYVLVSLLVSAVLFCINESKFFPSTSILFVHKAVTNISVVSFKCLSGGLTEALDNGCFKLNTDKKKSQVTSLLIQTLPESHSVPLRGIGDSFLPFEGVNTSNIDVLPDEFWFENMTTKDSIVTLEKGNRPFKKILFWNDAFGNKSFYIGFGQEPFVKAKCRISNCFTTGNRSLFAPEELDALIWHVRSEDKSFPPKRSPHTKYVFWTMESPLHVFTDLSVFQNIFNWTFTYRLDSDFPNPYDVVYRSRVPKPVNISKNYALGKKRLAAWFVSNCITSSGRETLVRTLMRWIKIDVYGKCGTYKCPRIDGKSNCYELLERNYKFYMSFENSLCRDYATEKVFNILRYDVVPVVYGLANYSTQLPPGSYIDALDFPTAKSLAAYLHYLDKNDTAYSEYFRLIKTSNFSESHLVPLRGIGDSYLPFEEEKAKDLDVASRGNLSVKKILFWNDFFGDYSYGAGFGQTPFIKCPVKACVTTADRSLFPLEEVDAVIWHARGRDLTLPSKRSPHTRYVFLIGETPMHVYVNLELFKNVFNWTFNYRHDSDFSSRFGIVYRSRVPLPVPINKNYAHGKTKLAAWFVSNCVTKSGRATLVKTLQKWVTIDVYGDCSPLKCSRGNHNCYGMLDRDYKFYLSFENSLCKDYATEKIFNALRHDVVPVVYGLFNYAAELPPGSYIDALAFPTAKSLADYLLYLDKNDTAYNEYFSWKPYHFPASYRNLWCDLCARLHKDHSTHVYNDLYDWFITQSECKTDQTPEISRFIQGLP
ncbi:uncharacterized protein [Palaemon carinicauda]|uniref:uncharacterized protein n=1 Tax=Palaemon carinicauda TaxID=392227 RepID=UPI0035B64B8B